MARIAEILVEVTLDPGTRGEMRLAYAFRLRHVEDQVVRRILLNHPRALSLSEVFEAVERTLCALGHDAIREDIPAHAFEQRR